MQRSMWCGVVWKERLKGLSRESTVERALLNYVAAQKQHKDWLLAMESRLAVYDASKVMGRPRLSALLGATLPATLRGSLRRWLCVRRPAEAELPALTLT